MKPMLLAAQYASTSSLPRSDQVVAVLHRRYRKYPAGGLDVGHRDLAQPRMADDAVVQQLAHGAELFVARHARVDAMKLPEIDLLDAELPEAALGLRNQIGGASVGVHCSGPGRVRPALVAISSPS